MHLKRWITAVCALPILIFLIYKGGIYFSVLVGAATVAALCEYFRIVYNPAGDTMSGSILVMGIVFSILAVGAAHNGRADLIIGYLMLNLIVSGFLSVVQFKNDPYVTENMGKQLQGVTYITLSLSLLVLIRNSEHGMAWIFFLIFIIFAGDTGAYYVGKNLGKTKLCPWVSPGKTVEGALGGLAANILVGSVFKAVLFPHLAWGMSILFFISVGVAGQIGDLFESQFKRISKIKDSGFILPGHGGILDRIDALLFAAPVAYLFKEYMFT